MLFKGNNHRKRWYVSLRIMFFFKKKKESERIRTKSFLCRKKGRVPKWLAQSL